MLKKEAGRLLLYNGGSNPGFSGLLLYRSEPETSFSASLLYSSKLKTSYFGVLLYNGGQKTRCSSLLLYNGAGFEARIGMMFQGTYSFPVCPKPPLPRSVSSSTSTGNHSACSWRAMTIWAMRSPSFTVNGSVERLMRMMPISPR